MHQLIIRIDPKGKATVKAEGYQGPSCASVTRPFIDALGRRVAEIPTEEMFATETNTRQVENHP
jgi:Protein of unknown function (DUF2997)